MIVQVQEMFFDINFWLILNDFYGFRGAKIPNENL